MVSLLTLVIYIQVVQSKLKGYFSPSFNFFLNKLFPNIKFLLFLLNLGLNWGFKGFSKKRIKINFF